LLPAADADSFFADLRRFSCWNDSMSTIETCLADQVHLAIRENPHLTRRDFQCEEEDGRVVLRGVVGSYYQKQMAQEALRRIDGVHQIENHLEVCWGSYSPTAY